MVIIDHDINLFIKNPLNLSHSVNLGLLLKAEVYNINQFCQNFDYIVTFVNSLSPNIIIFLCFSRLLSDYGSQHRNFKQFINIVTYKTILKDLNDEQSLY